MRLMHFAAVAAMTALAVLCGNIVRAEDAAATPAQAQQTPAGKFIQDIGAHALSIMADKSLSPDQRSEKYRAILHDSFDLPVIGHFVLGRTWNSATPQQQGEFMRLFEQLVLQTYGDRLNFYSGEGFEVKNVRRENDKDSVVTSDITHADGSPPTEIDWRVREQNGKPAVLDVVIAGVSQSVTQRQEYASIIQRDNGSLDGLLAMMRDRLQHPQKNQQQ